MGLTLPRASLGCVVLPAQAGDSGRVDDRRERVRQACGHKAVGFCCLFCHVRLANRYQLELHTAEGDHLIARWCDAHGAEEWRDGT